MRHYIRLAEDLEIDPVKNWTEGLIKHAKTDLGREWIRYHAPRYAEGWDSDPVTFVSGKRAAWIEKALAKTVHYIDRHRPNDITELDIPETLERYAVPELVRGLLPLAKTPAVRDWIKTSIPADVKKRGALHVFDPDEDQKDIRTIYPAVITYLNDHPPGRAAVLVNDVLTHMREKPTPVGPRSTMTNTPAFRAWFKDSVVVDKMGHPLVVYRGTMRPGDGDNAFGESQLALPSFTAIPEIASVYAGHPRTGYSSGSVVGAYYLSMQNPVKLSDETMTLDAVLYAVSPTLDVMDDATFSAILELLQDLDALEGEKEFKMILPVDDSGAYHMTMGELQNALSEAFDEGDTATIHDLIGQFEVDGYALGDCHAFAELAQSHGRDGIIHIDVFGPSGQEMVHGVFGKDAGDLPGMDYGDDDLTHVTYRPFTRTQIKSVFNKGTFGDRENVSEKSR